MKRHHLTLPQNGPNGEIVAILEDESGVFHHVEVRMPAERQALMAALNSLGAKPLGEARQRGRDARASIEDRVFATAEREHLRMTSPVTLAPAPVGTTKPARKPTKKTVKKTPRKRGR